MDDLSTIFKALSDPNRLAILEVIRERDLRYNTSADPAGSSVSEVAERFDLALSTVSHHLKELKNAGLIRCEKRGQSVYCTPDDDALRRIEEFVGS